MPAVDALFEKLRARRFAFAAVRGVSGAGQQHGSVYLKQRVGDAGAWSPQASLVEQVRPLLAGIPRAGRGGQRLARHRALHWATEEAQALTMQHHSDWIGERPRRLRVTGGASKNRGILQVLADVLDAEIETLAVANASALGAALRAAQAIEGTPFAELYASFAAPDPRFRIESRAAAVLAYTTPRAKFASKLRSLGL